MPDQRYANVRQMVYSLAEAAPAPLSYEELAQRRPSRTRSRPGWQVAVAAAVVVLVVVGIPLLALGPLGDESPATPRVTKGILITNASTTYLPINLDRYWPSPDGERAVVIEEGSWCIADLPAPNSVGDVLPLTISALSSGTQQLQCTDSLSITAPRWSPDGSRIVAYGQESTPGSLSTLDRDQTKLYVLDTSSLEVETVLDSGLTLTAIWVSNTEILYYGTEPQPAWYVASLDGGELKTISAPQPGDGDPVQVGDSTVIYRAHNPGMFADSEADEVSNLIKLDWNAGTATVLASLRNLNPGGQIPDPGFVMDITADLRYAILMATGTANEFGRGPTAYVYELESQELIPHTPPGFDPQTRTYLPFLVGDAWIAYTAIPDDASNESENHQNVYIAPLDDPAAAIELFRDGVLVDVHNDRLTIFVGSEGLVILDMDF